MTKASFFIQLKREYWEAKNWLIGLPLVLAMVILAAVIILSETFGPAELEQQSHHSELNSDDTTVILNFGEDARPVKKISPENEEDIENDNDGLSINFSVDGQDNINGLSLLQLFLNFGWISALFYLLNCLYNDRKDSSILFWKSLPVSDSEHVL